MISVLLADDHRLVRHGMRRLLAEFPDIRVDAEAETGDEALDRLRLEPIDVAVLDVSMPGPGIVELLRRIRETMSRVRVIVVSMHSEEQYALRVLRAGASGYVTKDRPPEDLAAAIRKAHAGGKYVSVELAELLANRVAAATHEGADLSDRELEVLRLMAVGRSAKQIAGTLGVSPKTVSTYRTRILEKLGLRTNADLVRYAIERGIAE